jgi:hypothetical protein
MKYLGEGVRVGPSPSGLGVFSLKAFHTHQVIGPIEGTIMQDPLYESDYCMELGEQSALEPKPPFRYLNHSCHPNCALVEFEVDREDGTFADPELWVEICAEIKAGEQLTIDYGWPARTAVPCACGCPDCRGWIVAAEERDQVPSASPRLTALRRTQAKYRRALQWLYCLWEKWNHRFFAGRLSMPQILLDRFKDSNRCGSCGPSTCPGARSRIRLRLSLLTGPSIAPPGRNRTRRRYRLLAEVLLHEMVHQWRREVVDDDDRRWQDHGAAFCRKCNEIGRELKLLPVQSDLESREGSPLPSCARWPHNARRRATGPSKTGA